MATEISSAYIALYTTMPGVKGDISKALGGSDVQGAVGESGNKVGKKFMAGLGKAVKIGAVAAAAAVAVIGVAAARSAAEIQTSKKVLTGLYGSAEDATRVMKDLKDVASQTAVPYQSYLKGGEALSYLGVKADASAGIMKNLGLAVIGTGGSGQELDRATNALTKMSSQGKVTLESLSMLSESGVPIMSSLADEFGVSIEQVAKMGTDGKIAIEDVTGAIAGGTGDVFQSVIKSGELAGDSFSNTWARVKDNVISSMGALLVPLLEKLSPMLKDAGDAVSAFLAQMQSGEGAGGEFMEFLKGAWNAAKGFFGFIGDNKALLATLGVVIGVVAASLKIATIAQWAMNFALAANPIGAIIIAIVALVAGLIYFFTQTELGQQIWANFTAAIGAAWTWLWESILKPVFDAIGAIFTWLWETIILPIIIGILLYVALWAAIFTWLWKTILSPIFALIGAIFTWIWKTIIMPIVNFIVAIVQVLGAIFTWLWANAIKPAIDAVGAVFTWLWETIIKPVADFIGDAITVVGDTINDVFSGIADFIGDAFESVLSVVRGPLNSLIDLINGVIGGLNSVKVTIPDWMADLTGISGTFGLNIPKIPRLADGAIIGASRGGSLVNVGEGRYDEAVMPLGGPQLAKIRDALTPDRTPKPSPQDIGPTDLSDSTIEKLARTLSGYVRVQSRQGSI